MGQTSRACARCGGSLSGFARSTARYCSAACRQSAYRRRASNAVPGELRERDRWVTWSPDKAPRQVDGKRASSTDPTTWTSYAKVRTHRRKGFVLGDGIACIDLDHCLVGGKPTAAAQAILDRVPGAYVEVSPSGDGLHIWGRAPERPGHRRDGFEVYSAGRYITVTGTVFRPGRLPDLTAFF